MSTIYLLVQCISIYLIPEELINLPSVLIGKNLSFSRFDFGFTHKKLFMGAGF